MQYLPDAARLDRMLNMIELSIDRSLRADVTEGSASRGFDPETKAPSVSQIAYRERARTAQEIKDTMAAEQGHIDPRLNEGQLADPAAALNNRRVIVPDARKPARRMPWM